ncbi:MAG TPA: hypothetical protein VNW97_07315 [Candidatus Saccharimonadales bacterium]|nr:hypothetical protein [Candidatus Saccharimonadales bacterium]
MQTSYSVELGANDPALEMPWRAADDSCRYLNLKQSPDLVLGIAEAVRYPALSEFLTRINAVGFPLETAKCDAWHSRELFPEEEIFGAECKFVSYIDLLFAGESQQVSFDQHEMLAKDLCRLLERAPEMAAAVEFVVRHCHFHIDGKSDDSTTGFCITAYVTGYGDSQEEALIRWTIALKLLQHALVQIATAIQ